MRTTMQDATAELEAAGFTLTGAQDDQGLMNSFERVEEGCRRYATVVEDCDTIDGITVPNGLVASSTVTTYYGSRVDQHAEVSATEEGAYAVAGVWALESEA